MPYDVRTLTHCSVHWTEALRSHRPEQARSHHSRGIVLHSRGIVLPLRGLRLPRLQRRPWRRF